MLNLDSTIHNLNYEEILQLTDTIADSFQEVIERTHDERIVNLSDQLHHLGKSINRVGSDIELKGIVTSSVSTLVSEISTVRGMLKNYLKNENCSDDDITQLRKDLKHYGKYLDVVRDKDLSSKIWRLESNTRYTSTALVNLENEVSCHAIDEIIHPYGGEKISIYDELSDRDRLPRIREHGRSRKEKVLAGVDALKDVVAWKYHKDEMGRCSHSMQGIYQLLVGFESYVNTDFEETYLSQGKDLSKRIQHMYHHQMNIEEQRDTNQIFRFAIKHLKKFDKKYGI